MESKSNQLQVIEYSPYESRFSRLRRRVPLPSKWTLILLALLLGASYWLWVDHDVWGIQATWPRAGQPGGRLSPDGKRIIVGTKAPFRVIELPSGRELLTFGKAPQSAAYAKFSPDGTRIITTGGDIPSVLDYLIGSGASGDESRHLGEKGELAFVHLWDASTGKQLGNYTQVDPNSSSPRPRFSPDGKRLIVTEASHAKMYDTDNGQLVAVLEQRDGPDAIGTALVSPDSRIVAVFIGRYGRVHIRSMTDNALLAKFQPPEPLKRGSFQAAYSPDSTTLALEADEWLYFVDPRKGRVRFPRLSLAPDPATLPIPGMRSDISEMIYSLDGRRLLAVRETGVETSLLTIDAATASIAGTPMPLPSRAGDGLRWSPDGKQLMFGQPLEPLHLRDATTLQAATQPPVANRHRYSADFKHMVCDRGGLVDIVSVKGWKPISSFTTPISPRTGSPERTFDVAFGGDENHVLTSSTHYDVRLWYRRRPDSYLGIFTLRHGMLVIALAFASIVSYWRDLVRFYR